MFENVIVKEKVVGEIPCLLMHSDSAHSRPGILLYHGWSSNRENQRFLGSVLAAQGYAVIAPDAPRHGLRSTIDFSCPTAVRRYFWEVVLEAVVEAKTLLCSIAQWPQIDPERIAVMGISMGSFISSAVMMDNQNVCAGVLLIGCGAWVQAAQKWDPDGVYPTAEQWSAIHRINPIARPEAINGRPLLLLHGDMDPIVSIELQREFYNTLSAHPEGRRVELIETQGLGHFLELDMIENASKWLHGNVSKRVEGKG